MIFHLQERAFSSTRSIVAEKTKIVLKSMRNEENFDQFWGEMLAMLSTVEVSGGTCTVSKEKSTKMF